uniref:Acyltransferase family protein n=1 Tax=Prevotella sp. GTC17262 TaxID=3236797 RepID=A0AB33JFL7_9BACT
MIVGSLDKLKIIATLLVVLGHVTRMYSGASIIEMPHESILMWLTDFIYSFHMPLFVFISGAIYYIGKRENGKYKDECKFILSKVERLLIPYLCFAILWVLPTMLYLGKVETDLLSYIRQSYLLGINSRHLWYLMMIFVLFIAFNHFESYFYRYTKFSGGIFLFLHFLSYVAPSYFQISATLKYLIYFYFGYIYKQKDLEDCLKNRYSIIFVILHLVFVLLQYTMIEDISFIHPIINLITSLFGIIAAVFIVLNFQLKGVFFKKVLNYSYGIYLYHPMIIYLLFFWLKDYIHIAWICSLVIFVISILASFVFVSVTRRLRLSFMIGGYK